ncbi:hypothetical protein ENBRE01_3447, partial [Enteropsectra breve]
VFLQNLSVQCDSERVLRLCEFSKKDEQNLRLEFFELLIDMLFYTENFRGIVAIKQNELKNQKALADRISLLRRRGGGDAAKEVEEAEAQMKSVAADEVNHPLKINLGIYKNSTVFVMDSHVMIQNENDFYRLNAKDLQIMLNDLNTYKKSEKSLLLNVKGVMYLLYNS